MQGETWEGVQKAIVSQGGNDIVTLKCTWGIGGFMRGFTKVVDTLQGKGIAIYLLCPFSHQRVQEGDREALIHKVHTYIEFMLSATLRVCIS